MCMTKVQKVTVLCVREPDLTHAKLKIFASSFHVNSDFVGLICVFGRGGNLRYGMIMAHKCGNTCCQHLQTHFLYNFAKLEFNNKTIIYSYMADTRSRPSNLFKDVLLCSLANLSTNYLSNYRDFNCKLAAIC